MPPALAALLTVAFIGALMVRDWRLNRDANAALWLPVMWMAITGSRFVSQWINIGASTGGHVTEGSPIDALYFLSLILLGGYVLAGRREMLAGLVANNRWLLAFFVYSFLSIAWSDFPFIALKRWIKTLGHPIMALIILTDPDPGRAFRLVMKRCAYLLVPTSVLFIKYFPQYGRGFNAWTGEAGNRGVGLTKNDLGYVCMLFGIFFLWSAITVRKITDTLQRRSELALSVLFLSMILWLLHMSDSATSLMTLLLGGAVMVCLGLPIVNKRYFGTYVIILAVVVVGIEVTFNAYDNIIRLLGRNPNLTDRTGVWADALALQDSPIIGAGFESFWLGWRLEAMWEKWWWQPNQAHNGYIETYLNLGLVGVVLLCALLLSTFRKISQSLLVDFDFARLRMAFLFAILAFNYTEASFKAVHLVWTIFHIIAIDLAVRVIKAEEAPNSTVHRGIRPNRVRSLARTTLNRDGARRA